MFLDNKHEDKRFMAAAIPTIQVACNFVMQAIFICCCWYQFATFL